MICTNVQPLEKKFNSIDGVSLMLGSTSFLERLELLFKFSSGAIYPIQSHVLYINRTSMLLF